MKTYECTLRLTSPETVLSNLSPVLSNVRAVLVREARYTTASSGQDALVINISGFSTHPYVTSTRTLHYTKLIMLQRSLNTTIQYFNPESDAYDVIHDNPVPSANFTVTALIDGEYDTDINSSNPLLLKIVFFYE